MRARSLFCVIPGFCWTLKPEEGLTIPFLSYEEQKKVPKFFMDVRVSEGSYF